VSIVCLGTPENYPFLAHKELAALLWTRRYCPHARFVLHADDTAMVDIFLLLDYIAENVNFNERDGLYGWSRSRTIVDRIQSWPITKAEYASNIYPVHVASHIYLLSNESSRRLLGAASRSTSHLLPIVNVYVTGILREQAQIPFYNYHNLKRTSTIDNGEQCDQHFNTIARLLYCSMGSSSSAPIDHFTFYDSWDVLLVKHNVSTF
jgi:hypothetical protein